MSHLNTGVTSSVYSTDALVTTGTEAGYKAQAKAKSQMRVKVAWPSISTASHDSSPANVLSKLR